MDGENSNAVINTDNPKPTNTETFPANEGTSSSAVSTSKGENGVKLAKNSVKKKKQKSKMKQNSEKNKSTNNVNNLVEEVVKSPVENRQQKVFPKKKNASQKKNVSNLVPSDLISPKTDNEIFLDDVSDESFEIEDIIRNPQALKLIEDLVNCFTCNSTLPENELSNLKLSLFERTCSVFLKLLNDCVEKTFNKVLNIATTSEFKKKMLISKDASCQTNFPGLSEGEESKVQQNVLT